MSSKVRGKLDWNVKVDPDGHRNYRILWLIEADTKFDGPANIFGAVGLPAIGDQWIFGNDNDPWAFCWPDWQVSPVLTKEPSLFWTIEQQFTTRPFIRCMTTQIGNPLLEPPRISGSFVNYTRQTGTNYLGQPVLNSSRQIITGQEMERDFARPGVDISINVYPIDLNIISSSMHTLNDSTLWGLPARYVKLSRCSWQQVFYGVCGYYFTINYGFDINFDTFDKEIKDVGTRVLMQGGDPTNPTHYQTYNENAGTHGGDIILDGSGNAWTGTGTPGSIFVQFYSTSNLLLLGIPPTF